MILSCIFRDNDPGGLLTPIWTDRAGAQLPVAGDIRKKVEQAATQAKAQVLDPDVTVQEMTGSTGVGFHYSATDRTPTPGEFTRMDQGMREWEIC